MRDLSAIPEPVSSASAHGKALSKSLRGVLWVVLAAVLATLGVASGGAMPAIAGTTASISGTVQGQGTPNIALQGATVSVMDSSGSPAAFASTDVNGNYSVTGLAPGTYTVKFQPSFLNRAYATQWWNAAPTQALANFFVLADGQARGGVNAVLVAGASISGNVKGQATPNTNLQGASVSVISTDNSVSTSAQTDANGNYSVTGLPAGSYTIFFAPPFQTNFIPQWWNGKPSQATADQFSLSAGQSVSAYNAVLAAGSSISGTVRVAGTPTTPLQGENVSVVDASGASVGGSQTDSNGNYSVIGLLPGAYTVEFQEPYGQNYATQWWSSSTSQLSAQTITLGAGQLVAGIDATVTVGASVSGNVELPGTPATTPAQYAEVDAYRADGSFAAETGTDANGDFTLTGLNPGSYTLHFYGPDTGGYLDQWWNDQPTQSAATFFSVTAQQVLTGFDATLTTGGITAATPTITGSTIVGQTLTAVPGAWTPDGVNFSYQWLRNGAVIPGATSATYALTTADLGAAISVTVLGEEFSLTSASSTSAPTAPITAPALTSATPLITGSPVVGHTLTANPGVWGPGTVAFAYQWLRGSAVIAGAMSSTYVPTSSDIGSAISVTVTGTESGYASTSSTSVPTAAVTAAVVIPPAVVAATPKISGTAKVGNALTAVVGTWKPSTVTFGYAWLRNGVAISGATKSKYTLVTADAGTKISLTVTGSKTGYSSASATSASTAIITGGTLTPVVPIITGTAQHGKVLTAVPGSWSPGTVELTYAWKRNGVVIAGATKSTYTVATADVGKTITVTVTGSELGFTSVAKTSKATAKVK